VARGGKDNKEVSTRGLTKEFRRARGRWHPPGRTAAATGMDGRPNK